MSEFVLLQARIARNARKWALGAWFCQKQTTKAPKIPLGGGASLGVTGETWGYGVVCGWGLGFHAQYAPTNTTTDTNDTTTDTNTAASKAGHAQPMLRTMPVQATHPP